MPATSHHVDRAAGAPGPFLPHLPALPQGRRPRARPSAEFQSVHPGGERRPGLFPGSVRNRGASFSFGLSPAQLESFIFFSHLCSLWSFKPSLFFFRFVCSYALRPFPPSPVTRFVRSPVAFVCLFCFFVLHFFLSVLAQLADCLYLSFSLLSSVALFNFLFPLIGCCLLFSFLSANFVVDPSPSLRSSPAGSAPVLFAVCSAPDRSWRPAVLAGSGAPSRDEGPRGGS